MQPLAEIKAIPTSYRGSENTASRVREEIRRRYGDEEASLYDPHFTTRTYRDWSRIGYRVRKGERAIKSITMVESKDKDGRIISTRPVVVNLFHLNQVERVS